MEEIDALIDRLNTWGQNSPEIVIAVLQRFEKQVLDMNRDQLYEKGINHDGESIGRYAPSTVREKRKKGQPTDRVTLRDKGDFHDEFFIDYDPDAAYIESRDQKTPTLVTDWGPRIFGLTEENLQILIDEFMHEALLEEFRNTILS